MNSHRNVYYPGSFSIRAFERDLIAKRREFENAPSRRGTVALIDALLTLPLFNMEGNENVFALREYIKTGIAQMEERRPKLSLAITERKKEYDVRYMKALQGTNEDYCIPEEKELQIAAVKQSLGTAKKALSAAIEEHGAIQSRLELYQKFLHLIDRWYLYFPN